MATLKDLESLAEYLEEAYVSKYAKYLDEKYLNILNKKICIII